MAGSVAPKIETMGSGQEREWQLTEMHQLHRFLTVGCEKSLYVVGPKAPTEETAKCVFQMLEDGKGEDIVREIVNFCANDKDVSMEPLVYALAVCARSTNDLKTKQAAYRALNQVCKIPTSLFQFVDYAEKLSGKTTGWGRAQRTAIGDWYNSKTPEQLALAVTKFVSRCGWSHADLLRLSHVKPKDELTGLLLKYVVKGGKQAKEAFEGKDNVSQEISTILQFLDAVDTVKHSVDIHQAARLIEQHRLVKEHVPTELLKAKEIWKALLQHMSLESLLNSLPKLASLGLLEPTGNETQAPFVIGKLCNEAFVTESRLHPVAILIALRSYEQGKAEKGKLKWAPHVPIVDALNAAFYHSFKNVTPTTKRILLASNLCSAKSYMGVHGNRQVRPLAATATVSMAIARSDDKFEMVAYSPQGLLPIRVTNQMSLQEVCQGIHEVPSTSTDPSLPISWALEGKKAYDLFIVVTNSDTWTSQKHPLHTLSQYRQEMSIPEARLVFWTLGSSMTSLGDFSDPGVLEVIGFDDQVPKVINNFSCGDF